MERTGSDWIGKASNFCSKRNQMVVCPCSGRERNGWERTGADRIGEARHFTLLYQFH
jgi:hypothetical protein